MDCSTVWDEEAGDTDKPKPTEVAAAVAEAGAIKYDVQSRAMEAAARKQGPITKYTSNVIEGVENVSKGFTAATALLLAYDTYENASDGKMDLDDQGDLFAGASSLGIGIVATTCTTPITCAAGLGGSVLAGEFGDDVYTGAAKGAAAAVDILPGPEEAVTAERWIIHKYVYSRIDTW